MSLFIPLWKWDTLKPTPLLNVDVVSYDDWAAAEAERLLLEPDTSINTVDVTATSRRLTLDWSCSEEILVNRTYVNKRAIKKLGLAMDGEIFSILDSYAK